MKWRATAAGTGVLAAALTAALWLPGDADSAANPACDLPSDTITITVTGSDPVGITAVDNDSLDVTDGVIVGGVDVERIDCVSLDDVIIVGDAVRNVITYTGSVNTVDVTATLAGGNDAFTAMGTQEVTVNGGAGMDTLTGGGGPDILNGDADDDTLSGAGGADNLNGGTENDTLDGGAATDQLDGGANTDTVTYAGRATDVMARVTNATGTGAGAGLGDIGGENDVLTMIENLTGGNAIDTLSGGPTTNILTGGTGADTLIGFNGDDTLNGGDGDDRLRPGFGTDTANGGAQTDTVDYQDVTTPVLVNLSGAAVTVPGFPATLPPFPATPDDRATVPDAGGTLRTHTLSSIENAAGGTAGDALVGGAGVNSLSGAGGNDLLRPGTGGGIVDGGPGTGDRVSYEDQANPVTVNLETDTAVINLDTQTVPGVENATGSPADDTLTGADTEDNDLDGIGGADILNGGTGNDNLDGGAGATIADTLNGGDGTDTVTYADRTADLVVTLADPPAAGTGGESGEDDPLTSIENALSGSGDDVLTGNAVANAFDGGAGEDTLDGRGADDDLDGGGDTDPDTVSYAGRPDVITATLDGGGGAGPPAENDDFTDIQNLVGGNLGDTLTGDGTANALTGGPGADTLIGGDGSDTLSGGTEDDELRPGIGNGSADGGDGINTVSYFGLTSTGVAIDIRASGSATGTGINQTLSNFANATGGSLADSFRGPSTANVFDGGGASDTVSYADRSAVITATLTNGPPASGTGGESGEGDTLPGIENITGGSGADVLTGADTTNTLSGGAGDDTLDGGLGTDTLDGGANNDTVTYATRTDAVVATLVEPGAGGGSPGPPAEADDFTSIENLIGGSGNDTLNPGDGNGSSADGGGGTDTVSYDGLTAGLMINIIDPLAGSATAPSISQTLLRFENATGGSGNDTFRGPSTKNVFTGNGGTADIVSYAGRTAQVIATLRTPAGGGETGENDEYDGIDGLTGGNAGDDLTGNDDANDLDGGPGDNDVLRPGTGGGTTAGGTGAADLVTYEGLTSGGLPVAVTATLDGNATFTPSAGSQALTGLEDLRGGAGADTLTGNGSANRISGLAGNDTIEGRAGEDVVDGGADIDTVGGGDDSDLITGGPDRDRVTYIFNTAAQGVTVRLDGLANDGVTGENDNILSVEDVTGGAGDDRIEGGPAVNAIDAQGGDDVVVGGGGDDSLQGGLGTDNVSYEDRTADQRVSATIDTVGGTLGELDSLSGFERIQGGEGDDTLTGSASIDGLLGGDGNDTLIGDIGGDRLEGEAGSDRLVGGGGTDALIGGPGNDELDGGSEVDTFAGDDGDDRIASFDGNGESVICGAGSDRVEHDATDRFDAGDCELLTLQGFTPPPFPLDPRPRDRDRDGAFDSAGGGLDCNDRNPAIRPGAPDIPGNAVDENCDGRDAPFPPISTEFSESFSSSLVRKRVKVGRRTVIRNVARGTVVKALLLRRVPRGATIEVRCTSKARPRCPFAKRTQKVPSARPRVSLRGYFGDRPLSFGTIVEVRITAQLTVGRSKLYTMRRSRPTSPKRTERCLDPVNGAAVACR